MRELLDLANRLAQMEHELEDIRLEADKYNVGAHVVMARASVEAARDYILNEMREKP